MIMVPLDPLLTWLVDWPRWCSEAVGVTPVNFLNYEPTQAVRCLQLSSTLMHAISYVMPLFSMVRVWTWPVLLLFRPPLALRALLIEGIQRIRRDMVYPVSYLARLLESICSSNKVVVLP